jgi:hypothetical protein
MKSFTLSGLLGNCALLTRSCRCSKLSHGWSYVSPLVLESLEERTLLAAGDLDATFGSGERFLLISQSPMTLHMTSQYRPMAKSSSLVARIRTVRGLLVW